ncbi:MAG: hypothetical protein JWQ27_738 [Ferruginibacter sp.]|nr:hypothetical protein [Ferruginibacter sp.]
MKKVSKKNRQECGKKNQEEETNQLSNYSAVPHYKVRLKYNLATDQLLN